MRNTVVLSCLLLCATPVFPQEVYMRGGEHGDFTRLTLPVGLPADWGIEINGDDTRTVEIRGKSSRVNLTEVFSRINRDRVSQVRKIDENSIIIEIGCECEAEYFIHQPNLLVIDIRDSKAAKSALNNGDISIFAHKKSELKNKKKKPDGRAINIFTVPKISTTPSLGPLGSLATNINNEIINQNRLVENFGEFSIDETDFQNELLQQLAAQATQGLLETNKSSLQLRVDKLYEQKNSNFLKLRASEKQEKISGHPEVKGRNIFIGSDMCFPNEEVRISHWVDPSEAYAQDTYSRFTNDILEEFDQLNIEEIRSRIRAYSQIGFGAEIRTLMNLSDRLHDPKLLAISYLLDGEDDPSDIFSSQLGCDTDAVLWAVLDAQSLSSLSEVDEKSLVLAFEFLPRTLRKEIGPRIARNLTVGGRSSLAKEVLRRLERLEGEISLTSKVEAARVDLVESPSSGSVKEASEIALASEVNAYEAMKIAIEAAENQRVDLQPEIVELASAYATEFRRNQEGENAFIWYIRSILVNEDIENAISEILNNTSIGAESLAQVRARTVRSALQERRNSVFMNTVVKIALDGMADLSAVTNLEVGERLSSLGFYKLSEKFFRESLRQNDNPKAHALLANTLIALNRPEEAEIAIVGMAGVEAEQIRAEARLKMKDYQLAREIYSDLGNEEKSQESEILGGILSSLVDGESLGDFTDLSTADLNEGGVAPVPNNIDAANILFIESSDLRAEISSLLKQASMD